MPITATKFCLPDEVKAHMNASSAYNGDDARIEVHIRTATALIRNFTRRSWERGTYVQRLSSFDIDRAIGRGSNVANFSLKERPLISVTSVKYNTAGNFVDTDAMDASDYRMDQERNAVVIYSRYMNSNAQSIQITYEAGFAVNASDDDLLDVDENLRQACAIQAASSWTRTLNQTTGKSQKQDQKGFANFNVSSNGLVAEAQAMLRGYSVLLVGSNG